MSHVFVSYSRKDTAFVDQLIRDLEGKGIEVWVDREDIRGGDRWRPAIVEAIRTCQSFVLVLSPNSVESGNVSKEVSLAETHKRPIIPISLQPCDIPATMEYQLAELQWIDFGTGNYQSALERLTQVLSNAPSATPLPTKTPQLPNTNQGNRPNRLRLVALTGAAVVIVAIAAVLIFRPHPFPGGGSTTPTPTITSASPTQSNSPQANNRIEAIRLTAEGVDAFYDENKSREGCVLFFNQAIKMDPTYADAYFYRGQVFVALKKNDLAMADFKKALELELEPDQRKATNEFLAGLQKPPATTSSGQPASSSPSPTPPNAGATPATTGAGRIPIVVASRQAVPKAIVQSQVADLFHADKSARIQATTRLIIDQKQNPETVSMAIASAQRQLDNKSGVINTLVYLENVSPDLLKSKRSEVSGFLDAVRKTAPGPQTLDHVNKVTETLNKP